MKKICFVSTVSITLDTFVINTAEYLHTNGDYDITFVCNQDDDFENKLPTYIHFKNVKMNRGINLYGISAIFNLYKFFKKEKFDLIQYSTPNASLYASIASFLARVPVRLYCQWGIVYVGFNGIKRHFFKIIEKIVCSLSSWIEPDSFGNLHFSHQENLYTEKKSSVIWNGSASGVNLKKFDVKRKEKWRTEIRAKHGISDEEFVFVFVGRITKDKGINELLEAFKKLSQNSEKVRLLIVGECEYPESLNTELYKWSQSSKSIIYCGFSKEVEKYLSASDVYILPSYREGFGSGIVEAEAMGVPVIVTDIPGPRDAMENNVTGIMVKVKDVNDLFDAMQKLANDYDLCLFYGSNSIKYANNNFEQTKLFEKILEDRNRLLKVFQKPLERK